MLKTLGIALGIVLAFVLVCVPIVVAGLWFNAKTKDSQGKVDCVPEATWSAWSECSTPCTFQGGQGQGGVQFRTRAIQTLPQNGGAECAASDLLQSQSCNGSVPCGQACVPDRNADAYAWSGCPACVPEGGQALQWRFVPPLQEAGPYGAPCALSDVFQTSVCSDVTTPCPPNQNCSLSDVLFSTSCNVSCGHGTQLLYRTVVHAASGGGVGCSWENLVEQVACVGPDGPTCNGGDPGCNPKTGEWSAWSACDATCGTGWQWATRAPVNAQDTCPLLKSQSCVGYDAVCTPIASAPPGSACTPPSELELDTACYLLCAGASLPPATDTSVCSVTQHMLAGACGKYTSLGGCMQPQDCEMGTWSAWGPCSAGGCDETQPAGGWQIATRAVSKQSSGGGVSCDDPRFFSWITQPCNNTDPVPYTSLSSDGLSLVPATMPPACVPHDCVLSGWLPGGACDVPCGSGWQPMYRSILSPATGGGTCSADPNDFVTSQSCEAGPCSTCTWESWDTYFANCATEAGSCWSACSAPCDGVKTATRAVATPAQPGGSCNLADAFTVTSCCVGCNCDESPCPLGNGGLPCSGPEAGTCTAAGTCACNPGFGGPECGIRCPEGPTGLVCNGAGTCNAQGTCDCADGFSGAACTGGGSCLVYQRELLFDSTTSTFQSVVNPLGCFNTAATGFTQDHCNMLQFLSTPAGANTDTFSESGKAFDLFGVYMPAESCLVFGGDGGYPFMTQAACTAPTQPYPDDVTRGAWTPLPSAATAAALPTKLAALAAARWPSPSTTPFVAPTFSADPAVFYPGAYCSTFNASGCENVQCASTLP